MPFTPWTTLDGYCDLLHTVQRLDLVDAVAPVQYAIRLLVPEGSLLLDLPDVRARLGRVRRRGAGVPVGARRPARRCAAARGPVAVVGRRLTADRARVFGQVRRWPPTAAGVAPADAESSRTRSSARPSRSQRALVLLSGTDRRAVRPSLGTRGQVLASRGLDRPDDTRPAAPHRPTGYQTRSFDEAARALGVELVFGLDRCRGLEDPWGDHALVRPLHDDDAVARRDRVGAADGADRGRAGGRRPAHRAGGPRRRGARAAVPSARRRQGQPQQARVAAAAAAAGLPVPSFERVALEADPRTRLAPRARSPAWSSRSCSRAAAASCARTTRRQFAAAFVRLRHILRAPDVRVQRDAPRDGSWSRTTSPARSSPSRA